jgi:hypothetical protein
MGLSLSGLRAKEKSINYNRKNIKYRYLKNLSCMQYSASKESNWKIRTMNNNGKDYYN